jgi:hypothetical protein
MRRPYVAAVAAAFLAGAIVALSVPAGVLPADPVTKHDEPGLEGFQEWPSNTFFVNTATWEDEDRSLVVKANTFANKGTLLTLTGIPASTWVDAFTFSSNYAAHFELPIPDGQAVPCRVTVRSAFATETVSVENAPVACNSLLGIAGRVSTGTDLPIVSGRVIVTVGNTAFTTTTDAAGNYALEVYSESDDAVVTITAEGYVGAEQLEWRIYEGSIDGLQELGAVRTRIWATELFGRNHDRTLFAASPPR